MFAFCCVFFCFVYSFFIVGWSARGVYIFLADTLLVTASFFLFLVFNFLVSFVAMPLFVARAFLY
jgi:hypothetical protein